MGKEYFKSIQLVDGLVGKDFAGGVVLYGAIDILSFVKKFMGYTVLYFVGIDKGPNSIKCYCI